MFLSDVGGIGVTFKGENIPVSLLSPGQYGGSISAFAGQTGELRFTLSNGQNSLFDDITFSSLIIPEPGTLALFGLGGFMLFTSPRRNQAGDLDSRA